MFDWELCKFLNIVARINKSSNSNQLPKVEFEDIIAGEGRLAKNISNKFDNRKGIEFEPSDILYGKLRPYLKNWLIPEFKGIALGDFWVFRANKNIPTFIYNLIQADKYQKAANDTSGTKMPRSDWKKVSNTEFLIPMNKDEQAKIGAFFNQLDNTIALHQRKLELLNQLKKAYLQQMFPTNGELNPKVRFANFTNVWEQRKLSEMAEVKTGFPFKNADFIDGGDYLVITNGNIQNNSALVDGNIGNRISAVSEEVKDKYLLNYGDILVTMDGTVGRTAKVFEEKQILAQRVGRLVANGTPEFLYQWLNTGKFFGDMTKVSHGGTIKHISLSEIGDFTAFVPVNEDERVKIGSLFLNIDKTITLHQHKLDKLKSTKKAFLQKMFI